MERMGEDMFYQPIVLSDNLYSVKTGRLSDFPEHWHSDLELMYCREGCFFVKIEDCEYKLQAGDILFVGSAMPHMYYGVEENFITILRVGSVFLGGALFTDIAKKRNVRRAEYGRCKKNAVYCRYIHRSVWI